MCASCCRRGVPEVCGVRADGSPFELMERLAREVPDLCCPTGFVLMADGVYIDCLLGDGQQVVIWCATGTGNRITQIDYYMSGDLETKIAPPVYLLNN